MSIEVSRLVRKLAPFDDGSGHRYVVTVSREREATADGQDTVIISITTGTDTVTIDANHWRMLREVIGSSVDFMCEHPDLGTTPA